MQKLGPYLSELLFESEISCGEWWVYRAGNMWYVDVINKLLKAIRSDSLLGVL